MSSPAERGTTGSPRRPTAPWTTSRAARVTTSSPRSSRTAWRRTARAGAGRPPAAPPGVWLASSLSEADGAGGDIGLGIFVNRSTDGIRWGRPVDAATDPAERYDKEWIACDNWASSPFRGRCYLTYLDFARGAISTRRSNDGGLTWSAPVAVRPAERSSAIMNGPQPVVRPDGSIVVPFSIFAAFDGSDQIGVFR